MRSSLGKLRRIALHKSPAKEKCDYEPVNVDQLAQASQDMMDMRNCYDSLLSAAAATANSAYEFSESLRDMGTCLLEKTSSSDGEASCEVLSMLGNVQFELQKLLDCYRSHVVLTITTPSESLLNELRIVEEMKQQCDEKRNLYEYMMAQRREKGRSKSGKGDVLTSQQLQAARDEYDEEATLCVFRLKSLRQGQSRSLLTQAARHHAAQLNFFRKGLQSLEAIEPHIRLITEEQHIDYQLSGLDDGEDREDEVASSQETNNDGELSFNYGINRQGLDAVYTSSNSMELDQVEFPHQASALENAEVNRNRGLGEQIFNREPRVSSHSAPIFPEKKLDPTTERMRAQKFHSYVLPTPVDTKSSVSAKANISVPQLGPASHSRSSQSVCRSSALQPEKYAKVFTDDNLPVPTTSKAQLKFKESSRNNPSVQLPSSLDQAVPLAQFDTHIAYDAKNIKRQAFSGPLTSKSFCSRPYLSTSGPITSSELPQQVSGLHSRIPTRHPSASPKVSPGASPPTVSPPRISELHELPRPPAGLASKPVSGHSAPLASRNQELSTTSRTPNRASNAASPLPTPPLVVSRSYSIPSSNQRARALHVAKVLESPQLQEKDEEVDSPPLTPIFLSNIPLLSTVPGVANHTGKTEGQS